MSRGDQVRNRQQFEIGTGLKNSPTLFDTNTKLRSIFLSLLSDLQLHKLNLSTQSKYKITE